METKSSGFELSPLVAGVWRLAEWDMTVSERERYIQTCLENGIDTFDHADIYGDYECEKLFGEALKNNPGLKDSIKIISKCGIKLCSDKFPNRQLNTYDTSESHIIQSVEQSLKNLNRDYLDGLLIHRPDPLMNADEVAGAFAKLLGSGKVRHFGVSNFSSSQMQLLQSACDLPLFTNQIEVSLTHRDCLYDGTLEFCQQHKIKPMIWSPLAGGELLNGNNFALAEMLSAMAKKYEVSQAQIAYAWVLKLPASAHPIIGTGKKERIINAVNATKIKLQKEDWFLLLRSAVGEDIP